jgi:hypothetical protein
MWSALPTADSSMGCVAEERVLRRRTVALGTVDDRARRWCPVRPRAWSRWPSLAGQRYPVSLRPTPVARRPRPEGWWSQAGWCTLGTGMQAIQRSPSRASLAGLRPTRHRLVPAFPAGGGPRWLSPRGQPGTLERTLLARAVCSGNLLPMSGRTAHQPFDELGLPAIAPRAPLRRLQQLLRYTPEMVIIGSLIYQGYLELFDLYPPEV